MKKKTHKIIIVEVVEDEQSMRDVLAKKFESEGFEVITAKDGDEGFVMAMSHHPDLVLLDLLMPRVDGITMLKKLREDEWGRHVPVIVLTNLSDTEKVAEAVEGGAFDFLIKADWPLEGIVKKVKERLGMK